MKEDSNRDNQERESKITFTEKNKSNFFSPDKNQLKNYIFQFLMVFLGITAGFFVENIRENYVESQRAEEYAG